MTVRKLNWPIIVSPQDLGSLVKDSSSIDIKYELCLYIVISDTIHHVGLQNILYYLYHIPRIVTIQLTSNNTNY